jgi:hypothetical protein
MKKRVTSQMQVEAWRQAAKEIGLPPRGKVGSKANQKRQHIACKVAKRAGEILRAMR